MNRRTFGKLAVGTALASSCISDNSSSMIDAHSHVWVDDLKKYPLQKARSKADLKPLSFPIQKLMSTAAPYGFERFVLIQHIYYHLWDYSYLTDCAAKYPEKIAVVGALDPIKSESLKTMESDPAAVSGYRIASAGKKDNWLEATSAFWNKAAELNKAVCLLRFANVSLQSIDQMCQKHPDTKVVLDHFGHVDPQDKTEVKALLALARHKNFYMKVSKFYGNGKKQLPYLDMLPFIKILNEIFGSQRLMWASDCPYQIQGGHNYASAVEVVRQADFLSAQDRDNIFSKTAAKIYFRA